MLLRGPASTTKEGGATVLLRGSQQVFVSLRIYEKYIDCLEHDMNALFMCGPLSWRGRYAVKGEALCARARARPLTARAPALWNGHTHEAHATRSARGSEWTALADFDGLDEFVGSRVSIEA